MDRVKIDLKKGKLQFYYTLVKHTLKVKIFYNGQFK